MVPPKLYFIFLTALAGSLLVMPSLYKFSALVGGIDLPDNQRKVHHQAIPRIGGVAIFCGLLITGAIFGRLSSFELGLITGASIIFAVGLADDLRSLTSRQKLAGQIIGTGAGVIISQNYLLTTGSMFTTGGITLPVGAALPVTIFCIVGLINSLNMIDGLDGLAGGVATVIAAALAVLAFNTGALQVIFIAVALLGAVIGFLAHNTHPARIFMGDSGSNLLGFILGMLSIRLIDSAPSLSPLAILLILSVPVCDTLYVMARRLVTGRPVMQADRGHVHHRLLDLGISHRVAVLAVFVMTYIAAAAGVMFHRHEDPQGILLLLTTVTGYGLLHVMSCRPGRSSLVAAAARLRLLAGRVPSRKTITSRLLALSRYLVVSMLGVTVTIGSTPQPVIPILPAMLFLPNSIKTPFPLLSVAGKAIILYVICKLIVDSSKEKRKLAAAVLATILSVTGMLVYQIT